MQAGMAGACTAACTHCSDWAASAGTRGCSMVWAFQAMRRSSRHWRRVAEEGPPDAGSLGWPAYVRFGAWMVLSVLVYCCYSVHSADARQHAFLRMQSSGWVLRPLPCAA